MTDLQQAAHQALEALEWSWGGEPIGTMERDAITALRAALAECPHGSDAACKECYEDEPEQSVEQALEALNKMRSIGLMMADGRHPRDVLRSFIHGAAPAPRKPLRKDVPVIEFLKDDSK